MLVGYGCSFYLTPPWSEREIGGDLGVKKGRVNATMVRASSYLAKHVGGLEACR